jgi:hypothetical protein
LIARVSRCTLDTENTLDGLFTENGITKTVSNVRELLLFSPLNIKLSALIVVVVMCVWASIKSLLMVNLLGLREPGASGLSPSVVEIEEHVVKLNVSVSN